jgi:hypothetical protein
MEQEKDWSLNVVGESYKNSDGSSRQAEVQRCNAGELIVLRREPQNRHDPDAVAVYSCRGVQVGYLSSDHAEWISACLNKGRNVRAIVERITGGTNDRENYGIVIRVNYNGAVPTLPPEVLLPNELNPSPRYLLFALGCVVVLFLLAVML